MDTGDLKPVVVPEMVEPLQLADRDQRATAIDWWVRQGSEAATRSLLPLAFRGNDNLDSGIIQVFTLLGPDMVETLLDTAFVRVGESCYPEDVIQHNINALAKYTAMVPAVLPKFLTLLGQQPPNPVHMRLLIRYLENLEKQPKRLLKEMDLGPLVDLVSRYRRDPSTWVPGQIHHVRSTSERILERSGARALFVGDYDTEWFLRRILSGDDAVFNKKVPKKRRRPFEKLAKEYCRLNAPQEAVQWCEGYTSALFDLLSDFPEAITQQCLRTAVRITRPDGEEAEDTAWRLITEGGLINASTSQFTDDDSLGNLLFDHLLRQGSITAMKVFHGLLLKGISPSQRACMGFLGFMEKVAGPQFSDRAYRLVMDVGNQWEMVCRQAAKALYGNVLVHPRLPNGKVPDLVPAEGAVLVDGRVTRAKLIVECKKSNSAVGLNETPSEKYQDYCDTLEIWMLDSAQWTNPETNEGRIAVVSAEDLISRLQPLDPSVADKVASFLSLYHSPFFEVNLFVSCAREHGVPEDIIVETKEVYEMLFPHFATLRVQRWVDPSLSPPTPVRTEQPRHEPVVYHREYPAVPRESVIKIEVNITVFLPERT